MVRAAVEAAMPPGAKNFFDCFQTQRIMGLEFPHRFVKFMKHNLCIVPAYVIPEEVKTVGLRVRCLSQQTNACKELQNEVYHDVPMVAAAAMGHAGPHKNMPLGFVDHCVVQIVQANAI